MKKNKLNNSGFVLVETLIVSVFIMGIFAILYNNFYPLMGEYEKREVYDDIDGKYAAYWIKRVIQHNSVNFTATQIAALDGASGSDGYFVFKCDMSTNDSMKQMCNQMVNKAQIKNMYITKYNLMDFKKKIDNSSDFSGGMHKYVRHLPNYAKGSLNDAEYRVIIEFNRKRDDNDYMAYSTIEVKK